MRRSALGDFLVAEVPVVFELAFVEVFEDALFLLCGLFDTFVEFKLRRMLDLLPFQFNGFRFVVARTMYSLFASRVKGRWLILCGRMKGNCSNGR